MSVLKIARMGHPVLQMVARPVEDMRAPDIQRLIDDMIETMEDAPGVGLAAPQVFQSLRILVYKVPEARVSKLPGDEARPVSALINPVLTPLDETRELGWEGCLSVPGLRGAVERHVRLGYSGFDRYGKPVTGEAVGFHARVLQHEADHLDATLYPQRMTDMRLLSFVEESARYPIDLSAIGGAA